MMGTTLISPSAAANAVAEVFQNDATCRLSVREDHAFKANGYVSLGDIELFPTHRADPECILRAVRYGEFEWRSPELDAVTAEFHDQLDVNSRTGDPNKKAVDKVRRICDSLGAVAVRLGLSHPVFDPHALESMPFRRPTTVISDTSGVLQGGLSFVARNLHPSARIKVPAVVQMEIVNFADRFLSNWRATSVKPVDLLMDHINSQAGQRVLLQLELHSDVELERTFLLGDPLRGAFQREEDKELKELNLNVSIRAYADRLILESARQHQNQVSFGHQVVLLTSDQGLARMAMAEGLSPLYFRSSKAASLFGRRLTGTNLHPFTEALCTLSVADVLWELATIFGTARLTTTDGNYGLEVHAIGKDLAWAPYHSHDDLLWLKPIGGSVKPVEARPFAVATETPSVKSEGDAPATDKRVNAPKAEEGTAFLYKMSVDRLLNLIEVLESAQSLPEADAMAVLRLNAPSAARDYRRFLDSGGALLIEGGEWKATPKLTELSIALRNLDLSALRCSLADFPSYAVIQRLLRDHPVGTPMDSANFGRATATYQTLAELTELGAQVYGRGFFTTPNYPDDKTFVSKAFAAYQRLKKDGGWAETGAWLEELIVGEGIHPLVTRQRLQEASERNLLRRFTEGSTTDTRRDRHTLRTLQVIDGAPSIKVEHLYRGDFLIAGKGSSSIRIEEVRA